MNRAGCFSVLALALLAAPGHLRADSPDADAVNPYAKFDPDGVPLSITQSPKHPLTAAQIESIRQQEIEDARARNWLMIQYEQQLRARSQDSANKDKPNLFLQLSDDKNLAKLAGLDGLGAAPSAPQAPELHASATPAAEATPTTLRQEAPAPSAAFTPLISPLSSSATSAINNYTLPTYSSSIPSILSPNRGALPANAAPTPPPSAHSTAYTDIADLQTPGMVAAKNNPFDEPAPDLSLDLLPGETQGEARAREEASEPATLAQALDASQLHREEILKLKAPATGVGARTTSTGTLQAAAPQAIPVNPADAPTPISQQQQLAPVHGPIANPYDILNR
jgi:hypothetical protein